MAFVFERFVTDGLAQISYLIGDTGTGEAFVIDPRRDVEIYLDLARRHGLAITHVFETHIHADFVSGSRELLHRSGSAEICVSREGGAQYGFEHHPVHDGDSYPLGKMTLTARHTPGHTPEHMSYEIAEKSADGPWAVFSGDALFAGSAGRPDLLGTEHQDELARQLYRTLYDYYMKLDDGVLVLPGHGSGSPCGANIADRLESSIAYERRTNPFLRQTNEQEFVRAILTDPPDEPTYYRRMKRINAQGPTVLKGGPEVTALKPDKFQIAARAEPVVVVDVREKLAFGGGHISGAINIGRRGLLSIWAGWMLDPDRPIVLVLERDEELHEVIPLFTRTGYDRIVGYLAGGMGAWQTAGLPMTRLPQMPIHELKVRLDEDPDSITVLDVRSESEFAAGRIPGAKHFFTPEFKDSQPELPPDRLVATYCGSGYRANIVASILQARGHEHVFNIPGSWSAWKSAGYPVENGSGGP